MVCRKLRKEEFASQPFQWIFNKKIFSLRQAACTVFAYNAACLPISRCYFFFTLLNAYLQDFFLERKKFHKIHHYMSFCSRNTDLILFANTRLNRSVFPELIPIS